MRFDKVTHKVEISSMTKDEAKVFIKFLESEIWRHQEDIEEAQVLIETVKHWYELKEE